MKNGKSIEIGIAYIHGRISHQLETFAPAMGISVEELTDRLGTLLLSSRQGSFNKVPKLWGRPTKGSEALAKVEVDERTHRTTQTGAKGYWAKMTPEERSKEMARRQTVRLSKKTA